MRGTCHNNLMDEIEHQKLWATEQRRRGILALLEVQPLSARANPPGAREARPLNPPPEIQLSSDVAMGNDATVLATEQAERPTSAVRQTSTHPFTAAADGSGKTETQPDMTPGAAIADVAGDENSAASGAPVVFQLLIVEAGAWLWLEQIEDNLIRREQLQLVEGMARSISQGGAVNLRHHQFDWPLANHAHLPKDAESAKQSVAGQLRRLARERKALGMILMGPSCSEWVSVPPALTQLNIPSTLSMLEKPLRKREAWQVLKAQIPPALKD